MDDNNNLEAQEEAVAYNVDCDTISYEKEWKDETNKRLQEVLNGEVECIPLDDVLAEARAILNHG